MRFKTIGRKQILAIALSAVILVPLVLLAVMAVSVTREATDRIERGAIKRVIASESPVYYDDGKTPIGVFFEQTHRQYIHYEDIPKNFIKAIIAAEDQNFLEHPGFDLKAIIRALLANIRAGKVVQGGSTITQQTVKNVFKRKKRSYIAKLKELIQAFLLERKYRKSEILEMYANQFFVTGYGKGLQIAAQYFFDKRAEELDLVEAAFIAGSVKGPNRYNPFIKRTEAEKETARRLAKVRKDYVLKNMLEMEFITREAYQSARDKPVPFKEGKITYRLTVVLDTVKEQLESSYFRNILSEQGIDNVATSGIRITTSVNKEIQEAALRSFRARVSEMDVALSGTVLKRLPRRQQELLEPGLVKSQGNLPFLSRITQIDPSGEDSKVVVSWEGGGGIIDSQGMKAMTKAWLKWQYGPGTPFTPGRLNQFLQQFRVGELVPVRFTDPAAEGAQNRLALSSIPELEGGIVVLHEGMVKALVGGFFNRFFNRAVDAKRQLGSIFKPLLYTAALQLKWNTLDALPNERNIFRFQNTHYLPRPDHEPISDRVSMVWAGAKSENLATVWLLYHLTDHLNLHEFRRVARRVGLARDGDESYTDYKERIRDQEGVVVDEASLMEAAFDQSKKDVVSDVIFGGYAEGLENLRRLHFRLDPEQITANGDGAGELLRYDFQYLAGLNRRLKERIQEIRMLTESHTPKTGAGLKALWEPLHNLYTTALESPDPRMVYLEDPNAPHLKELFRVTPEWIVRNGEALAPDKIWVAGVVPAGVIDLLNERTRENYEELLGYRRYDPEVLYRVRDFRTLVNLVYVVTVAQQMGIYTPLDPVLSFPLGPNSISILEAALTYQTIMTGSIFPTGPFQGSGHVPIITEIRDRQGEPLWSYDPKPRQVLSTRVSCLIAEILDKVVEVGTGRNARKGVRLVLEGTGPAVDVPIACFGKTGTANRFTNSSFVGFLPGPAGKTGGVTPGNGYVIAAYVGYDDNRPMKGKRMVISGASGALPLWIDTANAIVNAPSFADRVQPAELVFRPDDNRDLFGVSGLRRVPVSPTTGLPLPPLSGTPFSRPPLSVVGDVRDGNGSWHLNRRFEPLEGTMP